MKRKANLAIAAIIIILALVAGCAKEPTGQAVKEETVKIGAVLSLTGVAASYGENARQGIELAMNEINSKGGINGKKLVVIYEDDNTDAEKAVTAFNKLVFVDGVSALIGGTWDWNYNSIAPLAETNKITLVTWENVKTSGLIINKYTFVMRPELRKMVGVLKDEVENEDIKRMAIVRMISTFGEDLANGIKDMMQETGGEFVLDETYEAVGGNDFRTAVLKLKQTKADAVFIDMMDTDQVNFMRRAKEQGLDARIMSHAIIDDAIANPDIDHSLLNGIIYFDWDTPPSDDFRNMFRAVYGTDPARSADGAYDATLILAEALSKVSDKSQVNTYLENHAFVTINGEIMFKEHVVPTRVILVKKVVDGKAVILEKKEFTS